MSKGRFKSTLVSFISLADVMNTIEKLSPQDFEKELLAMLSTDIGYTVRLLDSFVDLDLDSLDLVELLLILEDRLSINIPDSFASEFALTNTIQTLLEKLKSLYYSN